jgi:hypothetical protein
MRTRIVLIVIAIIAVVSAAPPAGGKGGVDMLPPDAAGVITIHSLARLYTTFEVEALRSEYPEQFALLADEMIEDVGVDLLNPRALAAEGFDLERSLHVGFLTDPSAVVVLIPGEPRALSWVRAKLEDQGVQFAHEEEHAGTAVESDDADEVACFARDGYIAVVVTDRTDDGAPALATAGRLIDGYRSSPLTKSQRYRKVMSKLPPGSDVEFYMDGKLQRKMSTWGRSEEQLAERGVTADDMNRSMEVLGLEKSAGGMALRLESDRVTANSYNWVGKGAPILAWFRIDRDPVPFLRRAPASPWLIALGRVNGAALWKAAHELFAIGRGSNDSGEIFAEVNRNLGIDIERDVVNQINGNLGMLIERVSLMGQEAMVLAQVGDAARFRATVATMTQHARDGMAARAAADPSRPANDIVEETAAGVAFYRIVAPMSEVCYGVVDDHFVVTTTVQRFRDIVNGAPGLSTSMKNPVVASALSAPGAGVFYADFRGLYRDAQGFLPMMGPAGESYARVLEELSELVATSEVDEEGASQSLTLTSTSPGVWKRLLAVGLETIEIE